MKWYSHELIGFIIGMVAMYQLMKKDIGDIYEINNKVKNRKGQITDSSLSTKLNLQNTEKKHKFLKFFKRKNKKNET